MNLKPALFAGALLLALATVPAPAQAGPVGPLFDGIATQGDRLVECMDMDQCVRINRDLCETEGGGTVCDLGRSIEGWCDGDCTIGDPTVDHDHDLVPDSVERNFCGRSGLRTANAHVETGFTRCDSKSDLSGLADVDRDGIPNAIEPLLCGLEDQNTELDGSCDPTGKDYTL